MKKNAWINLYEQFDLKWKNPSINLHEKFGVFLAWLFPTCDDLHFKLQILSLGIFLKKKPNDPKE
jgi:hypothetical protein